MASITGNRPRAPKPVTVVPTPQTRRGASSFNAKPAMSQVGKSVSSAQPYYTADQSKGNRALSEKLLGPTRKTAPATAGGAAAPAPNPGGGSTPAPQWTPDAAYNAAVARLQYNASSDIADLTMQQSQADTAYNTALGRLREDRPAADQSAREGANAQGLFYSGQLGKRLGDIATQFTRAEGDLTRQYTDSNALRQSAIDAINQRLVMDVGAEKGASVARQVDSDQQAAADNALAPPAPRTTGPRGEKIFTKGGKRYYKRSDGKVIPVG